MLFPPHSSTYLALAPAKFHPGWKYSVQLTVHDVPNPGVRVTVTGNIFNTKKQSLGAGTISLDNGESLGAIGAVTRHRT